MQFFCVCFHCTNLVSVHELLADDVLTDAGGRHQVVELVEELYAALMVLRSSFTQLVPQDQSYTLGGKDCRVNRVKTIKNKFHCDLKRDLYLEEVCLVSDVL